MKTILPVSEPKFFTARSAGKLHLLLFAFLLCTITTLFAGVKPVYKNKNGSPGATLAKHAAINKGGVQAVPTISYTTPHTYNAGSTIAALTPTSSGVAAPAFNNTPATFASTVSFPFGAATDAAGNVYVAEPNASAISKIPAGGGTAVNIGMGFSGPQGVAVDAAGNVYVADPGNSTVKMVLAGGNTTVALGSGFNSPTGVAVDAAGNVYVADYGNKAVKEIPAGGSVPVTLASGLSGPYAIAVDNNGNVYMTEPSTNSVEEIPAGGAVTTISPALSTPEGIAVDGAGNLYVVNHTGTVQMIPAGSTTLTTIGTGFALPIGVAADASGNVFVSDTFNSAIEEISPAGGYFIGPFLPAGLQFNSATGVINGAALVGSPATNYIVTAYNSSGTGTAMPNIKVNALTISYAGPQTYTAGTAIPNLTPASSGVAAAGSAKSTIAVVSGFNAPAGAAVDAVGNLYIADAANNAVKKIAPGGSAVVSIGSGFNNPQGVAVDAAGNVYVADAGNNAIKKIPFGGGSVTTLGSGFSNPQAVALDAAGNVYVADMGHDAVKEISGASGTTITLSNNFGSVVAIALDAGGNVYVADGGSAAIMKLPVNGGYPVLVTSLSGPSGIAVDASGNIYAASHGTNAVYMIVGGSGSPVLISSAFAYPAGLAADGAGNVFVADRSANVADKILPAGGYFISSPLPAGLSFSSTTGTISGTPTTAKAAANYTVTAYNGYGSNSASVNIQAGLPSPPTLSYSSPKSFSLNSTIPSLSPAHSGVDAYGYGTGTVTTASLTTPDAVTIDKAGNIYVIQSGNFQILEIPAGGGSSFHIGSGFVNPGGVAVDASGNVYVADYGNNAVKKIPAGNGTPVTIGTGFNGPTGVAVDMGGNVYVADFNNNAIKEIQAVGGATVTLGSGFNHPYSVALDAAGNIYVSDTFNGLIKRIPAGNGTPVIVASGIINPYGLAIDAGGNLFVADRNANTVKEVVAGASTPVVIGSGFNNPYAVSLDGSGNVYVADYSNNALKKIKPVGGYFINSELPAGLGFNSNTGVISGKPTVLSPATNYTVTAYSYGGSGSATVNIKVVSPDATLSALQLVSGTLKPVFVPANLNYSATVSNATTSISVQPTVNFPSASISVNGSHVPSGTVSDGIALNNGPNVILIVVTAQDGVTTKTYKVTVTRISNIATLSNILPSKGTLTPAFAPATTGYYDMVANGNATVTLTPTASDPGASITVNGTAVKSGAASGAIALAIGSNTVSTIVTAQDGVTTQTYTVNVVRPTTNAKLSALKLITASLSPAFNTNTTSYTASVPYTTSSISVQPTAASTLATLTVDGNSLPSGGVSDGINLAIGSNVIPIVVTAQDGVTTDTYTVTIKRAAPVVTLSALNLITGTLSPAFSPNIANYTSTVSNSTASISVQPALTDPNASMTVQGGALASGGVSDAIALNYGTNIITIVVTGIDGVTTKTYKITVIRVSNIATLSNITLSRGMLTPAFMSATTNYSDFVANSNASVTLTPTASDAGATITVNGTAVKSGMASLAIALNVGSNTVTVVVTAQDGVTTDTYTVNVVRPSTNAKLANLTISDGTLSPVFNSSTSGYTDDVTNGVSAISVTPTVVVNGATVKINGVADASGTASDAIPLNVGTNTITIVVTAQDGMTTGTYTVTVTRNVPGMNNKYEPVGVEAPANSPRLADDVVLVHEGVSPNGDGINDILQIDGIGNYPDNKLKIMNRNGILIYEAKGYDNSSKVFDGHSNKNGQLQLPGTYFYSLDYTANGIIKHKTGFIVLKY